MKTHARVVVIGGGVVGASVLYHLTKAGWSDVVLIERSRAHLRLDLARGRRHAHASTATRTSPSCRHYTIDLYKEIEAISGQSCGIHLTGGLMLAGTPERHGLAAMMVSRGPLSRHATSR